jgi:hypothetical protein
MWRLPGTLAFLAGASVGAAPRRRDLVLRDQEPAGVLVGRMAMESPDQG